MFKWHDGHCEFPVSTSLILGTATARLHADKVGQISMTDERSILTDMDGFLASVEKQAFLMARMATGNSDNALDIVQDCMLRMVKNYARRSPDQWRPLFFRVLNNRITDYHRKRGFERLTRWFGTRQKDDSEDIDPVDQLPVDTESPEQWIESEQVGEQLRRALMGLTERQRQAFMLRQWQGLSVAETAIAMEISEGSVKTHVFRAIKALQLSMKEHLQL